MTHQNPTKGVDCFFPPIKKHFDAFSLSITMPASPKFLFLPSVYHGNSSEQKVLIQKLAYFLMGNFWKQVYCFLTDLKLTPCVFRIARYPLHGTKMPTTEDWAPIDLSKPFAYLLFMSDTSRFLGGCT